MLFSNQLLAKQGRQASFHSFAYPVMISFLRYPAFNLAQLEWTELLQETNSELDILGPMYCSTLDSSQSQGQLFMFYEQFSYGLRLGDERDDLKSGVMTELEHLGFGV